MKGSLFAYGGVGLAIGVINDALNPRFGALSIRYSLVTASFTSVLGGLCFVAASRFASRDIKSALEESA